MGVMKTTGSINMTNDHLNLRNNSNN